MSLALVLLISVALWVVVWVFIIPVIQGVYDGLRDVYWYRREIRRIRKEDQK